MLKSTMYSVVKSITSLVVTNAVVDTAYKTKAPIVVKVVIVLLGTYGNYAILEAADKKIMPYL